jgi:hypothetical protein
MLRVTRTKRLSDQRSFMTPPTFFLAASLTEVPSVMEP